MENLARRFKSIPVQDQENVFKARAHSKLPRQGLIDRGALGELNTNVETKHEFVSGKMTVAAAEFGKNATLISKCTTRSNYYHVQSKIDTGLTRKVTQHSNLKPSLRREESTCSLAVRAVAQTKVTNKTSKIKEASINNLSTVKVFKETKIRKANVKGSTESLGNYHKEQIVSVKEIKETGRKAFSKDPTESLEKLQLTETQQNSAIAQVKKHVSKGLPPNVDDIDSTNNNFFHVPEYAKYIFKYLKEMEIKYAIEKDHLKNQLEITGKMRATLIDWLVDVQNQFCLHSETFQLTVGIIDRYLQAVCNLKRNRLQLVGVTAMFIACKCEEVYAPEIGDFIYMSDNAYSKADILHCEKEILRNLNYSMSRPIPLTFLRRLLKAVKGTNTTYQLAKYFVDLCLVEYTTTHYRPSELAAASLCLSIHLLSNDTLQHIFTPNMKYYSGYNLKHIEPIVKHIAGVVVNVSKTKTRAVYKKYLDVKLSEVSSLPQLKGKEIYKLVET